MGVAWPRAWPHARQLGRHSFPVQNRRQPGTFCGVILGDPAVARHVEAKLSHALKVLRANFVWGLATTQQSLAPVIRISAHAEQSGCRGPAKAQSEAERATESE